MNILFIAYGFTPSKGGVERVTDIITRELLRRNHRVYFLCGRNDIECSETAVPVIYMDKSLNEPFDDNSRNLYREILRNNGIEVIINQYPINPKSNFFLLNALNGLKKVSFYHGKPFGRVNWEIKQSFRDFRIRRLLWALKKFSLEKRQFSRFANLSDKVCLLSDGFIKSFIDRLNIDRELLISVPNPFPVFSEQSVDVAKKENIIIFVGRVSDEGKNLIGFIKVWAKLSQKVDNWKALIIGDDSGCEIYKDYINNHAINNIEFCGQQSNIQDYFRRARIQCMTSHSEGWPMVLMEGMAEGCIPVVYETFESVRDIIEDNVSGCIINAYDEDSMIIKLMELINHEQILTKMSSLCRERSKKFSVENIVDDWESKILNV